MSPLYSLYLIVLHLFLQRRQNLVDLLFFLGKLETDVSELDVRTIKSIKIIKHD
jgi:hypothetical protein